MGNMTDAWNLMRLLLHENQGWQHALFGSAVCSAMQVSSVHNDLMTWVNMSLLWRRVAGRGTWIVLRPIACTR